jgi:hypothetical protein
MAALTSASLKGAADAREASAVAIAPARAAELTVDLMDSLLFSDLFHPAPLPARMEEFDAGAACVTLGLAHDFVIARHLPCGEFRRRT